MFKYNIKHICRILALILLSAGWAAGATAAEYVLFDSASPGEWSGDGNGYTQSLTLDGATFVLSSDKLKSASDLKSPAAYAASWRVYRYSSVTISSEVVAMKKVIVTYEAGNSSYINECELSEGWIGNLDGNVYTLTSSGLYDITLTANNSQVRITRIAVSDEQGGGTVSLPTPPALSVASGNFHESFNLEMTCTTPGAGIYYTLDGTEPSAETGIPYTNPILIEIGHDWMVRAIAVNEYGASAVTKGDYTYVELKTLSIRLTKPGALRYYLSYGTSYNSYKDNLDFMVEPGSDIYVELYPNSGYKLTRLTLDESPLDMQRYFNITMGPSDMTLEIAAEFDPSSPSDPQPGDTAKKYTLTLVANPVGSATFNSDTGQYAEGETAYIRAYQQSGYKFVNWTRDGQPVELNGSYFTMPASDVVLTANMEYNPNSPGDPEQPKLMHPLTSTVSPAGAGSVSLSSDKVAYGEQWSARAYSNTGYRHIGWIVNGIRTDVTSNYISGTMTDKGVALVALYQYDPSVPGDPNANSWNPETGVMIVDHFSQGNLYSTITGLCPDTGKISHLIVKGVVSNYDYNRVCQLTGLQILDFSRTSGLTRITQCPTAATVVYPATVTEFSSNAFSGNTSTTSIVLHATKPPVVDGGAFSNFTNSGICSLYVPEESMPLYEAVAPWNDFVIMPIVDDAHVLQVNLPADCADGRYKNKFLEIVNTSTGVRQKYVVSDRLLYTFNGLQKDEVYNVYLNSQEGLEIGRIENVMIPDGDISVTFDALHALHKVSARITADGKDVTRDATVEWLKPMLDGTTVYLRKTAELGEVPEGQELILRVTLPESVGSEYLQPEETRFAVNAETAVYDLDLAKIPTVRLIGKVLDSDGNALQNATVAARQTVNGRFSRSATAKTDSKGAWNMNVLAVPQTLLTYSALECVNRNDTVAGFEAGTTELQLGDVRLRSLVGARINYRFTYKAAGSEETSEWYDDHDNVSFVVENLTQKRSHADISNQYPILAVLDENIAAGDSLRITATSRKGAFAPIIRDVKIGDDQRAETRFDIVGKGGISASFRTTDNPAVVGMLYDAAGNLKGKKTYSEASLSFTELEDGDYTLVSMARSALLNSIQRLSNFAEIGMKEGKDYVASPATVETGRMTEISIREVPIVDESLFSYTKDDATSVTFNKPSVTTGNYLTFNGKLDFKPLYKERVGNVALVVDFPEDCGLVENSVIQGTNQVPYVFDSNRLTIQLGDRYQGLVRFCVIPAHGGSLNLTASTSFTLDGAEAYQPLGTASASVKELEIVVPGVTASPAFKVGGTARANAEVEVYEGNELIGSGKADRKGNWTVACKLNNPYNLSKHTVYAKLTSEGTSVYTESKDVNYNQSAIEVSKVTMINTAHPSSSLDLCEYVTEFDFQNPKELEPYWYWPSYPTFTFLVEFTANDPEIVSDVVLYVHTSDGGSIRLRPVFDEKKLAWVASGNFDSYALPTTVSLDYTANAEVNADATEKNEAIDTLLDFKKEYPEAEAETTALIDAFFAAVENGATESEIEEAYKAVLANLEIEDTEYDTDGILDSEASMKVFEQEFNEAFENGYFDNVSTSGELDLAAISEMLEYVDISRLDTVVDENELLELGYEMQVLTDSSKVYVLRTDTDYIIVDPVKMIRYAVDVSSVTAELDGLQGMQKAPGKEYVEKLRSTCRYIESKFQWIDSQWNKVLNNVNTFFDWLDRTSEGLETIYEVAKSKFGTNLAIVKILAQNGTSNMNSAQKMLYDFCKDGARNAGKWMTRGRKASACFKRVWSGTLSKVAGKVFGPLAIISDLRSGVNEMEEMCGIYLSIPDECPDDEAKWSLAIGSCASSSLGLIDYWRNKVALDVVLMTDLVGSAVALVPSMGASMATLVAGIAGMGVNWGVEKLHNWSIKREFAYLRHLINSLDCHKQDDDDNDNGNNHGDYRYPGNDAGHVMDPSGYVYEAVPSNRVEGVQASIYYKETVEDMYGDLHENVVLWDAEEYAQQNPLFTDAEGMYCWDVPQGLWQVKYEKDGYQTTYSDWLPVPPPQLDVNVAISQARQPEVTEARAYEEGVEVQFDKFMDISTLTTSNIFVTASGKKVAGEVTLLDSEVNSPYLTEDEEADATHYASRIRFVPETPLSMSQGEVVLTVSRNVLSYAGIPMTETYTQRLDIEKEVQAITADDIKVLYGGDKELTVFAVPFDAAAGRTLRIKSSSNTIATVDQSEVVLDSEGKAVIRVRGEIPGSVELNYTIDDVTAKGSSAVDVLTEIVTAEAPTASRASGTAVYRGTKVALTTDSKDAVIYFTTDGTCPCDENGSRRKYTVPVVIDGDTQIMAMTQVGNDGKEVSDVVTFNYTLIHSNLDIPVADGWTWVSHNMENPVAPSAFEGENVGMILGQTAETVRDPKFGFIGSLTEMVPVESYKLRAEGTASNVRLSDVAWNPASPIALNSGWNWLGYPVDQTMTVAEALQPTEAETLDMIVGQNGFAQFDGETWTGTLATMQPGAGYMYYSVSDKELIYNTSIVSKAAAQNVAGISSDAFAVDIHKYPRVMPVVARLADAKGDLIDLDGCDVYAFSGTECRGIGRNIGGKVMLAVYGEKDEPISFKVRLDGADELTDTGYSRSFGEEMLGSVLDPHLFTLGVLSGIDGTDYTGGLTVTCSDYTLHVRGIDPSAIDSLELFNTEGRKSFRTGTVTESGVSVESLPAGTYIVVIRSGESYSYHKTLVH